MIRRAVSTGYASLALALMGSGLLAASPVQAAPAGACVTSQLQQVVAPGSARPLEGSVPVVFIHGILSTAGMWDVSSAGSIAGQVARSPEMRGATAWTFDYASQNLDWVTNPAIGPAFARAVSCLAQRSGHKVVIVAHSMGGLAGQFAVGQPDPYGGRVADHVAELITIGTPFQGSWLLSAVQALRSGARWAHPSRYLVVAEALESACAGARSGACGLVNVPPSAVGTALTLQSGAIRNLPPWPGGLRVYDVAGDIQLIQLVAGTLQGSVDVGDMAVLTGSATAHDTIGKPFEESCGTETLWNWIHLNGGPCYHVNLASNPDVIPTVLTAILARLNDVRSWTPVKVAPGPITSVSCSGLFCAAVGATGTQGHSHGYALTYSGGAWSAPAPLGTGDTYTVSCPSGNSCVAVSDAGYAYTLRQNTWSAGTDMYPAANVQPSAADAVDDLSCASSRFCVAVTAQGKSLTWNGTNWSAPQAIGLPDMQPPIAAGIFAQHLAVSCPTTTFCLAGASIDAFNAPTATWDGTHWSATPPGLVKPAFLHVSCASATYCMVAGGYHAVGDISSIWNGASWSAVSHPAKQGAAYGFNQVSCPVAGICVGIDGGAAVNGAVAATHRGAGIFTWSQGNWAGPVIIDSGGVLDSLSCSHAGLCVAADDSGNVFVGQIGLPAK